MRPRQHPNRPDDHRLASTDNHLADDGEPHRPQPDAFGTLKPADQQQRPFPTPFNNFSTVH